MIKILNSKSKQLAIEVDYFVMKVRESKNDKINNNKITRKHVK